MNTVTGTPKTLHSTSWGESQPRLNRSFRLLAPHKKLMDRKFGCDCLFGVYLGRDHNLVGLSSPPLLQGNQNAVMTAAPCGSDQCGRQRANLAGFLLGKRPTPPVRGHRNDMDLIFDKYAMPARETGRPQRSLPSWKRDLDQVNAL